ncbi:MAG: hypothetical protein Ct9H300mP28_18190 [Pseudomonadota bacterium]|nr:MAG: hypothetical protein Ct9H300mP28_18190 [Pseudomonadota bacterium]
MVRKYGNLKLYLLQVWGIVKGIFGFLLSAKGQYIYSTCLDNNYHGSTHTPSLIWTDQHSPTIYNFPIVSLVMLLEMVIGPFWVWIAIGERPSITMILGAFFGNYRYILSYNSYTILFERINIFF